jgi:hypothetical protein
MLWNLLFTLVFGEFYILIHSYMFSFLFFISVYILTTCFSRIRTARLQLYLIVIAEFLMSRYFITTYKPQFDDTCFSRTLWTLRCIFFVIMATFAHYHVTRYKPKKHVKHTVDKYQQILENIECKQNLLSVHVLDVIQNMKAYRCACTCDKNALSRRSHGGSSLSKSQKPKC